MRNRTMGHLAGLAAALFLGAGTLAQDYVPARGDADWERRDPSSLGLDPVALRVSR